MADYWRLADESGIWLMSDLGGWLLSQQPVLSNTGTTTSKRRQQLVPPYTSYAGETDFVLNMIARPIIQTQFINDLLFHPTISLNKIFVRWNIHITKITQHKRNNLMFTPVLKKDYTLTYNAKVKKVTKINKKMKYAKVINTNYYLTLRGKVLKGMDLISRGIAIIFPDSMNRLQYFRFKEPMSMWMGTTILTAELLDFEQPSSVIGIVVYDTETQEMVIEIGKNGRLYSYHNIPLWVYEDFKNASSKGRFYNDYIKGGF